MNLEQVKKLYLEKDYQFLLLNELGILVDSCNTLSDLTSWHGTPIYDNIPFFETLKLDLEQLNLGERKHYNCFSFPFNNRQGTYDVSIQKEFLGGDFHFICVIEDRTQQYKYWLSIQQERNLSQINEEVITKQSEVIQETNRQITDSINYAKRIQRKILPSDKRLKELLQHYFLVYLPKDIVSGDFYWVNEIDDRILFCVADATGHGVPGAIMSVIGNSLFNDAIDIKQLSKPSQILQSARHGIIETLKQNFEPGSQFDGMDAAMCSYNRASRKLQFSGANNPVIIVSAIKNQISVTSESSSYELEPLLQDEQNALFEIQGDKLPIALFNRESKDFSNYEIQLNEGDTIYLFSDGYRDQFGGEREKKYGYKRFKELLLNIAALPLEQQQENLEQELSDWKKFTEQIDDICILGLSIL